MLVRPSAPDACGIAFSMTNVSTAAQNGGFSVTDASCVAGYTFAHELGHNMGIRHDWFVDTGVTPFRYGHGYVNPAAGQRWRTVMAYPDMCNALGFSCSRVLYWSNPDKRFLPGCDNGRFNCGQLQYWFYPGAPMGIPAGTNSACQLRSTTNNLCDADDRRALNETAFSVANFRQATK
jgi:Metallo-peptidase family M12B Reprolysin-like